MNLIEQGIPEAKPASRVTGLRITGMARGERNFGFGESGIRLRILGIPDLRLRV